MGTVLKMQFDDNTARNTWSGGFVSRDMHEEDAITLTERAALMLIDRVTMICAHAESGDFHAISPLCRGVQTMATQLCMYKISDVAEQLAEACEEHGEVTIRAIANRLERLAEAQILTP